MTIKIELNGVMVNVTKEQIYALAANGRIQPETIFYVDGKPFKARSVKGIVFGTAKQTQTNETGFPPQSSPSQQQEAMWYYSQNETQQGPIAQKDLILLIQRGILNNDTIVWREGMTTWMPISETELPQILATSSDNSVISTPKKTIQNSPDILVGIAIRTSIICLCAVLLSFIITVIVLIFNNMSFDNIIYWLEGIYRA